jgi:hypothetical protein
MKPNATLAVCSAALLAACGGGSSGVSNNPTLSTSAPVAERKIEIPDDADLETINALIDGAQKNDYLEVPFQTIANGDLPPEYDDEKVTIIVGDTISNSRTVYYAVFPSVDSLDVSGARSLFVYNTAADAFRAITSGFNDSLLGVLGEDVARNIEISAWSGDDDYNSLYAAVGGNDDYVFSEIETFSYNNRTVYGAYVEASPEQFIVPNGPYTYRGIAAVQWDDGAKLATGEVEMTANFGMSSSTANITASNLAGTGSTAAFSGSLEIDNSTGSYFSSSATIVTNGNSNNAKILGLFNQDATKTAGVVFDTETAGERTAGVFALSR